MKSIGATAGFQRIPTGNRLGGSNQRTYSANATEHVRASMAPILAQYNAYVESLVVPLPQTLAWALEPTLELADYYVPVDTGRMAESGHIKQGKNNQGKPMAAVIYGGPDLLYTPIVHERMDTRHERPTQAKWLQRAMEEDYSEFLPRLKRLLRT